MPPINPPIGSQDKRIAVSGAATTGGDGAGGRNRAPAASVIVRVSSPLPLASRTTIELTLADLIGTVASAVNGAPPDAVTVTG